MDGTADAGKVEDELVILMTFYKDDSAGQVRSLARYFSVKEPRKADADGMIACLQESLQTLGIDDILNKTSV